MPLIGLAHSCGTKMCEEEKLEDGGGRVLECKGSLLQDRTASADAEAAVDSV